MPSSGPEMALYVGVHHIMDGTYYAYLWILLQVGGAGLLASAILSTFNRMFPGGNWVGRMKLRIARDYAIGHCMFELLFQ